MDYKIKQAVRGAKADVKLVEYSGMGRIMGGCNREKGGWTGRPYGHKVCARHEQ